MLAFRYCLYNQSYAFGGQYSAPELINGSQKPRGWRDLITQYSFLDKKWKALLQTMEYPGGKEETKSIFHTISAFLRSKFGLKFPPIKSGFNLLAPGFLPPKLRRDNLGKDCKTEFQLRLVDALYDDDDDYFHKMTKRVELNFIYDSEEILLSQLRSQPQEQIFALRWLMHLEIGDESTITSLEAMRMLLGELLQCQCEMIRDFLGSIKSKKKLLFYYHLKWCDWCAAMTPMEALFEPFTRIVTKIYDHIILNSAKLTASLPTEPKFTVWRLMTKIWVANVYNPLKKTLLIAYSSCLSFYYRNLPFQIGEIQSKIIDEKSRSDLELFISRSFEEIKSFDTLLDIHFQNLPHQESQNGGKGIRSILKNYLASVLDISLNEYSIHYLSSMALVTDSPFDDHEKILFDLAKYVIIFFHLI